MKKLLITTSALVAATAFAGAAQAADPIKLSIGGFGAFAVGMASQDDEFTDNDTGGSNNPGSDYSSWDVKGNNEVHFRGSTTLDNGITVSAKYEFEAGGRSMSDPADEWNITVGTAYGTFIFGAEDAATVLIAKGHNDVSGSINGFDEGDALAGSWVAAPGGVTFLNSTAINTAGDAEKISYVSPTFAGFTFGATAVPALDNTGGDTSTMPVGTAASAGSVVAGSISASSTGSSPIEDVFGVGAMWNGEFSGVGIGVEAGYVVASPGASVTSAGVTNQTVEDWAEWQAGATFSYAGFTLGGAYRNQDIDLTPATALALADDNLDRSAWELGLSYETGPYGVSLGYFKSEAEAASTAAQIAAGNPAIAEDEAEMWQLSGSYTMGPGVDLKMSGGVIEYDDANSNANAIPGNNDNDGTFVMTGMVLSF